MIIEKFLGMELVIVKFRYKHILLFLDVKGNGHHAGKVLVHGLKLEGLDLNLLPVRRSQRHELHEILFELCDIALAGVIVTTGTQHEEVSYRRSF